MTNTLILNYTCYKLFNGTSFSSSSYYDNLNAKYLANNNIYLTDFTFSFLYHVILYVKMLSNICMINVLKIVNMIYGSDGSISFVKIIMYIVIGLIIFTIVCSLFNY